MKKVIIFAVVALMTGWSSIVAVASNQIKDVQVMVKVADYTPIEVKDLPQAVQDTLKKDFPEVAVKEAAVETADDGTKTFKVTLVDADGAESDVFLNEKGEIIQ